MFLPEMEPLSILIFHNVPLPYVIAAAFKLEVSAEGRVMDEVMQPFSSPTGGRAVTNKLFLAGRTDRFVRYFLSLIDWRSGKQIIT